MLQIRPAARKETRQALRLILDQPGLRPAELHAQVDAFLKHLCETPSPAESQYVGVEGNAIVAAAVCLDSAGRTTLVFAPSMRLHADRRQAILEVMDRLLLAARQRGVRLFQALLPPASEADARLFGDVGFWRLAELIYLERPATVALPIVAPPEGLSWIPYGPTTHGLFCQVIQSTYQDSLDCPGLAGKRDIEDIIAGHKDTGEFDARHWFVLLLHDEPIGCLLLARVRYRAAMELVYMGLTPTVRGRGLGNVLLARTIEVAAAAGLAYVTLAVDAANAPAYSLYQRAGFTETMRREAWILTSANSA